MPQDLTTAIFVIIWMHWLGDFVFQSDEMAKNKSKDNGWLTIHVMVYSLAWVAFGWKFALFNACAHWVTDWCTSRVSSKLWEKKKVHYFFVVIGFDQAIHLSCLVGSYLWLR